ncbi:glyoxalase [Serratia fonticola]|uniref:VOC family protein n=1 Tax=Serratia fonticola TaxID=47917 RepID=UPI0008FCE1E3|nr:VOC family protein [Serratia fonticola]MBC3253302.1 VOC family protein [Serratia fonticola]OIX86717.1 glyoxalase [Serratia fonticola]QCR61393.1 bleomycin resistance family protein [Serratia fonticola]
MTKPIASFQSSSFVIAVRDLKTSSAYFGDVLGFDLVWPEGMGWQLATRGCVRIMLGHSPDAMSPSDTGDHNYFAYLYVDDAQTLYDEFVSKGAIILAPPVDKAHGMREFTIGTPDGHRMVVGQDLERE